MTPFQVQANGLLRDLGFKRARLLYPEEGYPYRPRELELDTQAGKLYCSVHSDFLACIFWEVGKANAHPLLSGGSRLNPYSGKWVWYSVEPLDQFKSAVMAITKGADQCPSH